MAGVAFSADGRMLATFGTTSGVIGVARLWNVATGRAVGSPLVGDDAYIGAAFDPQGTTLATASIDGTVRFWDVATGRQLGNPLPDGVRGAESMALSPDGTTLAVGSTDGVAGGSTVRLFDVATRQQIGAPLTVDPVLYHLAFSPDGKTLVAVDDFGTTIESWNVAYLTDLPESLCASAVPFLTSAEWAQSVQEPPYQDLCP